MKHFSLIPLIIVGFTINYSKALNHCPISDIEYEALKQKKLQEEVDFTWVSPSSELRILYRPQSTSITISITKELYEKLKDDIQRKFIAFSSNEEKDKNNFSFLYKCGLSASKDVVQANNSLPYYVSSIYRSKEECQPITVEDAAKIITDKKILFYTGAGISASAVPAMNKLEEMIGFIRNDGRPDEIKTIANILIKSEVIAKNFEAFVYLAVTAAPTPAHKALSILCNLANTRVLTENMDLLHEASGVKSIFAGNKESRELCTALSFKKIDVLICIGLSHDDRGFIGLYKHCNPQGRVLALDFSKPEYLDGNDLLLKGDIQQMLPLISNYINDNEQNKD